jgi:hypothetical protein
MATARGETYADLATQEADLRAQVASAQTAKAPALPALQKQLGEITAEREALFKGETLRGQLLTTFGFSAFGAKAGQLAVTAYGAAALLALLSIVGFAQARRTSTFAPLERQNGSKPAKRLVAARTAG